MNGDRNRSPRAARNETQARVTRVVLGGFIVLVLGGAGFGVSWLRKLREERRRAEEAEAAVASRPSSPKEQPASGPATSRATTRPRDFRPADAISAIRKRCEDGSVDGLWRTSQALRAEAAAWQSEGAPDAATNILLATVVDVEREIITRKPSFHPLRAARGEVRWPAALGEYEEIDNRFLSKADAARLTRSIRGFDGIADQNHGWVSRAEYEAAAAPLVQKALEGRRAFDAMLETRPGRAARAVEIRDLADLRNLLPTARFRAFYHLPYLILVEQNDRWEESEPAARVARTLLGLRKTFFEAYGTALGLVPDNQRPVPVVVLSSRESYHRYRAAKKESDVLGTEAHFEPKLERLVVHDECARDTLLHEGTHQLIRANTPAPLTTYQQSFWFHEGIAEWFAGSRPVADGADGLPRFEIGLLLLRDLEPGPFLGPLAVLEQTTAALRFPLARLVGLMVNDQDRLAAGGPDGSRKIRLVYAQGWFLIYFLDHFAVDDRGIVRVGAPGKYRKAWRRYLASEIGGKSGEIAFREVLAAEGLSLEAIEPDMNAYLDFVIRKVRRGHVRDQKLVPWNEVGATESRPAATEDDDRLREK